MDKPWLRKYQPTVKLVPTSSLLYYPTSSLLAKHKKELAEITQKIKASPHSPFLWLARAEVLQSIGFPDLAVGDAHKARLLIEDDADKLDAVFKTDDGTRPKPHLVDEVFRCLTDCLVDCNAFVDAEAVWQTWREKRSTKASAEHTAIFKCIVQAKVMMQQQLPEDMPGRDALLSIGHVLVRDYPWVTDAQSLRDEGLLRAAQDALKVLTSGAAELRSSDIRGKDDNVWGIFAKKDIRKGDLVFIDVPPFAVCDEEASGARQSGSPTRCAKCCKSCTMPFLSDCTACSYCSDDCRRAAANSFHAQTCPKTLPSFPEDTNISVPATRPLRLALYGRYLTTLAAQASSNIAQDPLTLPLIARLTQNADGRETHAFNYFDHIVYPTAVLSKAGVDIYTDPHWDTWVLLTIRRRIDNNNHGRHLHAVYPNMVMLNHSCEPNLDLDEDADGGDSTGKAALHMRAARNVKTGEELTIRYTGDPEDDLNTRRYALLHWLGNDCQCSRCEREQIEQEIEDFSM